MDRLVGLYALVLLSMSLVGSGPDRIACVIASSAILAVWVGTVIAVRNSAHGWVPAIAYRAALVTVILGSYLLLKILLPVARPISYDHALLRVDRFLFGTTPSEWLAAHVTPARTEWFSFFYFSYFALLAVHLLPMLFLSRRGHLVELLAWNVVPLFCLAQLMYFVVPGFGPHRHLTFATELPAGRFYDLVRQTVEAAGAQKDIFPSLHTAAPTMLALFSFRHRNEKPFRHTWPLVAFFAVNIAFATLFLRWHWGVDVVSGVLFALAIDRLAPIIRAWEAAQRTPRGLRAALPPLPVSPAAGREVAP